MYTDVKILISDIILLLQLFAALFFFMLLVLGVGTAVALLSAVITVIRDDFPRLNYLMVSVVVTVLGFVGGLLYVTPVSN
jgi:solute carrier family 6 amino acid transporter-like protein 5/7/9/14